MADESKAVAYEQAALDMLRERHALMVKTIGTRFTGRRFRARSVPGWVYFPAEDRAERDPNFVAPSWGRTGPPHFLIAHRGVHVFRCYNHGDPREGFTSFWFRTTDEPVVECHDSDFDVRCFPADLVERHELGHYPTMAQAAAAIREAIDRGIVTRVGGPRRPYIPCLSC